MSRNYPGRFIEPADLIKIKTDLGMLLRSKVQASGVTQPLIVRDLVPSDYGVGAVPAATTLGQYTNQVQGNATAYVAAFTTNPQLKINQAIGINGIADLAAVPTLMEARFILNNAQTMDQVRLSPAYATGVNLTFIDPPIVYLPNETINWQSLFNAATAAAAEAIDLIGLICEPSGLTVTAMTDRPQ